jgi:hypothetical protein
LEISKRPFSPSSSPSALSRRHVQCNAARRCRGEPARPLLLHAGAHASRGSFSTAFGFALELPCRATRPRRAQSRPRGRRLVAAVVSSLQRPPSSPSMRTGTTRTPALYSTRPFASSAIPRHRTRRRSTQNAGELHAAVDPPLQPSSARADTLASSVVTPRSSSTTSPRPTLTGEP